MAFEKVSFDFPHEANKKPQIDVEDSGAIEVDISGKEEKKVEEPVEEKVLNRLYVDGDGKKYTWTMKSGASEPIKIYYK